jgi:two-component system nitrogen regulation response regulator GlnG
VPVHVPPLRERLEDLPLLVDHFLAQVDPAATHTTALPAGALEMFRAHRWPGNVRELRNVVRRMQMLPELGFKIESQPPAAEAPASEAPAAKRGDALHLEQQLLPRLRAWQSSTTAYTRSDWLPLDMARRELQDAFELDYLGILKKQSGGVKARAAHWAAVSRQAIQKLVRKHDFDWSDDDTDTEV